MKRDHEYVFNVTNNFEKDLSRFTLQDQETIESYINFFAEQFDKSPSSFESYIMYDHYLSKPLHNYTSSLHKLRINKDIRLFATFDNDPIFNQVIVTLLGCLYAHESSKQSISDFYEFLYDNEGIDFSYEENDDSNNANTR